MPGKVSLDGLASYLQFGSVQDPLTVIDGVRSLLPGHYLFVDCKEGAFGVKEVPYANCLLTATPVPSISDRREAVAALRQILEESLRLHLVSDVPLGAFLSGGIDSSSVVATMAQRVSTPVKTFSIGFTEAKFSEVEYARLVAGRFATEHHELILEPDVLEILD